MGMNANILAGICKNKVNTLPRNISSGCDAPGGPNGGVTNGTVEQQNLRSSHWNESGVTVTELSLMYSGWYSAFSGSETDLPNDYTVTASIEYPAATFTQVTWDSGSTSKLITSGSNILSDYIAVSIPAGAQFWVRTFITVASGEVWPSGRIRVSAQGEAAELGIGLSDKTMGGSISSSSSRGLRPSAIISTYVDGMCRVSEVGWGDSIMAGTAEGELPDAHNNSGWVGRAASGIHPYICVAVSGMTLAAQVASGKMDRRLDMISKAGITFITACYGVNDTANYATMTTNLQTFCNNVYAALPQVRLFYSTIGPSATASSAVFFKTATQTPATRFNGPSGISNQFNDLIRTKPYRLVAIIDNNTLLSTALNSGIWKNGYEQPTAGLLDADFLTVSGSPSTTVVPTDNANATSYFASGGVDWLTGTLSGTFTSSNVSNTGPNLTFGSALASAPTAGDTCRAYPNGCRQTTDGLHPIITTNAATASEEGGVVIMRNNKIIINNLWA